MTKISVDIDAYIAVRVAAAGAAGSLRFLIEDADLPEWVRTVLARHVDELDAARQMFDAAEQREVEHA